MATNTVGDETIVRFGRWLIGVYYVLAACMVCLAVLFLLVALGDAIGAEKWTDKALNVVGWGFGGLSWGFGGFQLYNRGRTYSGTWVAIGPAGVRLQLPRSDGDLLAVGREERLAWDEIHDIAYEQTLRKRDCTFTAGSFVYTLGKNNCPSPGLVAKLMAERKGVPLASKSK